MNDLTKELLRQPYKLTRAYMRLTDAQKRLVGARYARHAAMCRKMECEIDPRFLAEFIADVKKGVEVQ